MCCTREMVRKANRIERDREGGERERETDRQTERD